MKTELHARANLGLIKKTQMLGHEEPSYPIQNVKFPRCHFNKALYVLPRVEVPANIHTQDTELIS